MLDLKSSYLKPLRTKKIYMTSALLNSALILVGLGAIGLMFKRLIWNGHRSPSSHVEYGRQFSSYAIFAAIISSTHFFIKNDLIEAVIKTSLSSIIFILVGFLLGYAYSYLKIIKNTSSTAEDNQETNKSFNMQWVYAMLGACGIIIYFYFSNQPLQTTATSESKWIKITHIPKLDSSDNTAQLDYYYIDEASKKTEEKYVYAFTGRDVNAKTFLKYKMQADCTTPKFRIVESYEYGETMSDGLNKPISEDKNYQKTMTSKLLELDPSYIYDGGWITPESLAADLSHYNKMNLPVGNAMAHMAKTNKAILDFLCN